MFEFILDLNAKDLLKRKLSMGLYHDTPTDYLLSLNSIQSLIWPEFLRIQQDSFSFILSKYKDSNLDINSFYSFKNFSFLTMPILAINNLKDVDAPEALFLANINLYVPEVLPTNSELSTFFANGSFLLLFLTLAFYWFELAFLDLFTIKSKRNTISNLQTTSAGGAEGISGVVVDNSPESGGILVSAPEARIGKLLLTLANLFLIALLSIRWKESGHFPLSNLYESLMFLSWSCTTIHLFLIGISGRPKLDLNFIKTDRAGGALFDRSDTSVVLFQKTKTDNLFFEKLLGAVLAPLALFLNAFATFSLPKEMQVVGPLVPALQSNWLMMHVTVMIISYAALILGSLLSIVFVIVLNLTKNYKNKSSEQFVNQKPQAIYSNLDYLSYRIIGIGFPFLTIGILSGAVWANEAWGSYWSWDPKETWALLTWLIFAIYLHTRLTKGWEGEKPALIASFGFIVVWICYLGVNLLGEGLHSYGFFNT